MADRNIPVLRATDAAILKFFDALRDQFQFNQNYNVYIIGADNPISIGSNQVDAIKKQNGHIIRNASIARPNAHVEYNRSGDTAKFNTPDVVRVINNNNSLNFDELLALNKLISKSFEETIPASKAGSPEVLSEVVASHQQIIIRLEESLERINSKFAEERLKVQKEQAQFIRNAQDDFAKREAELRQSYAEKEDALREREKHLDDRDHIHARRQIRGDLKRQLADHSKEFRLTEKTRGLRNPIHAAVLGVMTLLISGIWYFSKDFNATTPEAYLLLIKPALLTVAALGIATWYIRWMNRWFEQHADAEFYLKQFSLDVDRASWVVETTMEWRKSPEAGGMPDILLESITRNLFSRTNKDEKDEMHPADYLASALLGNASHAKVKFGDAEVDYRSSALKKAGKALSGD